MNRISLKDKLKQGLFLLDGAMGTELIARGIQVGTCHDYLNVESPEAVFDIHRAYLRAGSDAVLTNTFGSNRFALTRHGLAEETKKINEAGARIARRAAGEQKYVLGDIGPSGDFLEPLGALKPGELQQAFSQQAKSLLDGGVDGFIIETMTALDEARIAVEAVQSACQLPVLVSLGFDRAGEGYRTMMGLDVESAAAELVPLGIAAVGFNCGKASLDEYVELAERFVSAVQHLSHEVAVCAEPNAGKPELADGKVVYKVSPVDFALAADKIFSAGVSIIGGCCGTSPAHIEAVAKRLKIEPVDYLSGQ